MRIRSDLKGVVYAQSEGGVVCLSAGDTVPDGVDVGEHLTSEAPGPAKATEVDESAQPETGETEHAGRRRGRRSAPRADADD